MCVYIYIYIYTHTYICASQVKCDDVCQSCFGLLMAESLGAQKPHNRQHLCIYIMYIYIYIYTRIYIYIYAYIYIYI